MLHKISIIIPTYKRDKELLKRTIDSALGQTYKEVEVIVVDDNSDENYRQIAEELMRGYKDTRIVYHQNEKNMGAGVARNEGIKIAQGKYIAFLDDDDIYLPEKLENQLKFMLDNALEMSFTNLKCCNEKNQVVDIREYTKIKSMKKEDLLKYHITRHITGTPTFMYTKELLEYIGGFPDANIAEEYYLMLKTIESNAKIGYLPTTQVIANRYKTGGLSYGGEKLSGEEKLYAFKKKYFSRLNYRERIFVRFRHYLVMGIGHRRNKNMLKSMICLVKAGLISPIDTVIEGINLIGNIRRFQ